ncbi:hypothetical protein [Pinibacter aurantiacus]|uniref:DUF1440 domain-containing protein n=1 Tax=Pinibacter aurantiacus TaxID=2851599 RepID=A0A9E2W1S7_9BACT|nr:hypothetical protein [Pinibacter aurantiacus]MBV4356460.1 hypothetical protein [Pinibacter aurantiacus]
MNDIISKKKNSYLPVKTIAWAGLLVGSLDILAAIVNFKIATGKDPVLIFQYIASAVFGKEAYSGGSLMPILGLIFHFIIAYIFTIIFFIIYPKMKLYRYNAFLIGIAYGILIWIAMNVIVVPLSKIGKFSFKLSGVLLQASILIVMIGIPLSLICKRYYSKKAILSN